MVENRCYDSDCADENCRNPEHYNHICFDPECNEVKCENSDHYDQQLLKEYQENTDLSVHDHSGKIDYDKDVYGYLLSGKYNKGHMILLNYLKFFNKRVYYYRNPSQRISIYLFGSGRNRNTILRKCGMDLNENKLTFLLKSD